MRDLITFLGCSVLGLATCCAQNPRWKEFGAPIPAHAGFNVRWEVSEQKIPPSVWVYHMLPNRFSPEVISNLIILCSFTPSDLRAQDGNGLTFQSSDGARKLSVSFIAAKIHYEIPEIRYGITHLAEGVPLMSELPELTTNLLQRIDVPLSFVTGYFETDKFNFWQPFTEFYGKGRSVTNIAFRAVNFRRTVDDIPMVAGDGGGIYFGEHGKITRLSITWHQMKRVKAYPTVSQKSIIDFVRQGRARQSLLPDNVGGIDWPNIKGMTIKKALPCYYAGNTDWLYPFVVLFSTVDTGQGAVDVQIECPVFDETKV